MPISGMIVSGCWHTPAITILVPRGASIIALLSSPGAPTHSKIDVGALPAIFSTCSVSGLSGSTASVAPNLAASVRRFSARSLTMTWRAPRNLAHSMVAIPTGPAPITSTVAPRSIFAISTACRPTASGSTNAPSRNETLSGRRSRRWRRCAHTRHRRRGLWPRPMPIPLAQLPRGGAEIDAGIVIAAADERKAGSTVADLPAPAGGLAEGDDFTGEFVAHDRIQRPAA